MSTAIMQTGAMGWDYKFHDWNESNDVGDIQLKVSILKTNFYFPLANRQNQFKYRQCVFKSVNLCAKWCEFLDYYQFI